MGAGASMRSCKTISNSGPKKYSAMIKSKCREDMTEERSSIQNLALKQLSRTLKSNCNEENLSSQLLRARSMPDVFHEQKIQKPPLGRNESDPVVNKLSPIKLTARSPLKLDRLSPISPRCEQRHSTETSPDFPLSTPRSKPSLFVNISTTQDAGSNFPSVLSDGDFCRQRFPSSSSHDSRSPKLTVSPRGTVQLGSLKIREDGIDPANSTLNITEARGSDFLEIGALGTGASGVVVEALHIPTMTIVALKMLPIYSSEKRQQVSRELAVLYKNLSELSLVNQRLSLNCVDGGGEAAGTTQSSGCGNLLSMYNAFVDPRSGLVNLVIEYMDGGSLQDLVNYGGCQNEGVLRDIAGQTLEGLRFLHVNKSVHRDIKPANILCATTGQIKIADFGISKVMDGSQGFANSFVGTVCYMSPERISGANYSFSSDIWSFGLTLLAVAKGRFPLKTDGTGPSQTAGSFDLYDSEDEEDEDDDGLLGDGLDFLSHKGGSECDDMDAGASKRKKHGGYWAMIKAICDHDAPTPGPAFTPQFNAFIGSCLCKEPKDRASVDDLLADTFIMNESVPQAPPLCTSRTEPISSVASPISTKRRGPPVVPPLPIMSLVVPNIQELETSRNSPHVLASNSARCEPSPLSLSLKSSIVMRDGVDVNTSALSARRWDEAMDSARQAPVDNNTAGDAAESKHATRRGSGESDFSGLTSSNHSRRSSKESCHYDIVAPLPITTRLDWTDVSSRCQGIAGDADNCSRTITTECLLSTDSPGRKTVVLTSSHSQTNATSHEEEIDDIRNFTQIDAIRLRHLEMIIAKLMLRDASTVMQAGTSMDQSKWRNLARQLHVPLQMVLYLLELKKEEFSAEKS